MNDLDLLFGAPEEERYRIDMALPDGLRGRVFLNGPARFQRNGVRCRHWLDGDGMVASVRFDDTGVEFARRYVQTHKWRREEEAGRPLFRTFGTSFPDDRLADHSMLESAANVSVCLHGGKLLAFAEQGRPYVIDPETLETLGEWGAAPQPLCAHPKVMTDALVAFSMNYSPAPSATLFEFEGDVQVWECRVPLLHPHLCHDFAVTDRFAILHLSPLCLDGATVASEGLSPMGALHEVASDSGLLIAARRGGVLGFVRTSPGYVLHFVDALECGDFIAVDLIESERPLYPEYAPIPSFMRSVSPARPVRYVIDVPALDVVERGALSYGAAPDFPTADPGVPGEEFWMLGMSRCGRAGPKFYDQLVHARWQEPFVEDVYTSSGYLGGEPIRLGPYVVVQHFDGRDSSFLVFEARYVARGPILRIPLRTPTPFAFHHS